MKARKKLCHCKMSGIVQNVIVQIDDLLHTHLTKLDGALSHVKGTVGIGVRDGTIGHLLNGDASNIVAFAAQKNMGLFNLMILRRPFGVNVLKSNAASTDIDNLTQFI